MIYAIINQCIILIRIIFSMYSCLTPPIYDYCWNHSFILAHLFHYKTLDFSIVIGWLLRCHYFFRLITKYKITKVSHPSKHCLFSFTFACRPPYSLTFNTWLTEVIRCAHILHPIFPMLQPLQGFCSTLCRCRWS